MKKPLPLTMVPPTRTAGLKKYGKISARAGGKPEYLVWHVADCTLEEAWTRQFYYTSKDVLRETAAIYNAVSEEVPETVESPFRNISLPGLVSAASGPS